MDMCVIKTVTVMYSLGHWLHTFPAVHRLTQPSTFHWMVKWALAFALINNNKCRWWMWIVGAIYLGTHSPSWLAWSDSWQPPSSQSAFIKWTAWTLAIALVIMTAP